MENWGNALCSIKEENFSFNWHWMEWKLLLLWNRFRCCGGWGGKRGDEWGSKKLLSLLDKGDKERNWRQRKRWNFNLLDFYSFYINLEDFRIEILSIISIFTSIFIISCIVRTLKHFISKNTMKIPKNMKKKTLKMSLNFFSLFLHITPEMTEKMINDTHSINTPSDASTF